MQQAYSAVTRCPVEIWQMILRAATFVDRIHQCQEPVDRYEVRGPAVQSRTQIMYDAYFASIAVKRDLASVCRTWHSIVYPFLLEWIFIYDLDKLEQVRRVIMSQELFGGRRRASLVRRLEIWPSSVHESEWHEGALALIKACNEVREFGWHRGYVVTLPPPLISILADTHAASLMYLHLCPYAEDSCIHRIADLLTKCTSLKLLDVDLPSGSEEAIRDVSIARPLTMRTLAWTINERNWRWLDYFASLDLPSLRHVRLNYDKKELSETGSPPQNLPAGLVQMFKAHGSNLTSLEVRLGSSVEAHVDGCDDGVTFTLLSLCPNLTDLVINLQGSKVCPMEAPHRSLQRIAIHGLLHSSFYDPGDETTELLLTLHIVKALDIFCLLCSCKFPSLKVIRCFDIMSSDGPDISTHCLHHHIRPYRELLVTVQTLCKARDIRLEDCLGQPLHLNFVPRPSQADCCAPQETQDNDRDWEHDGGESSQ